MFYFEGAEFFIKSLFTPLGLLCVDSNVLAKAQTHHNKIIKRSLLSGSYYIFRSQTRYCSIDDDDDESGGHFFKHPAEGATESNVAPAFRVTAQSSR